VPFTVITLNTIAFQSADILYCDGFQGIGSLRIFEQNAATVEVFGQFGSLDLASLGQVTSNAGTGFVVHRRAGSEFLHHQHRQWVLCAAAAQCT
jgi:hypothetical protein